MGLTEKHESWKRRVKDRKLFRELLAMTEEEKSSAFYKDLEFGTAGIRGIMGAGTNRINIYTVRKITQGIVLYMHNHRMNKVVISYDSRTSSDLFAQEAACVFAAAGVTAYITPELMPSPFLSFATRRLGADIGVMITASHNPREYNGYKVYDATGCQLRDEQTKEVAANIAKIDAFRLRMHSFDYYLKRGTIIYTTEETEREYLEEIGKICPSRVDGLNVVYTPLNGTGYRLVPKVLEEIGCKVISVPGQDEPSGKFTTCPIPNPEKKEALRHGIKLLKSEGADLLIANDPDADRIGVAYISGEDAEILSGNEMGVLMCEYLLRHYKGRTPVIVKTIVSTDLALKIAAEFGAQVISVPTGFKYIGNVINGLESNGDEDKFLLGFEESQGYLIGTHVRDKDAVIASKLIALIANELKKEGKTFGDKLKEIYAKYGNYAHRQIAYTFEGEEGEIKMKSLLAQLRENPLTSIAGKSVSGVMDYSLSESADFPPVNMLRYEFDGGSLIIRPSGTEPLIKLYASSHLSDDENEKTFKQIKKQFNEIFA
ncbi:MAG: phospho-sugar mutase [Clostridiales bacterium]|nr:phospho-sugar mutase [Clostridiales bacterium]